MTASSSGSRTSIRATSIATLPLPITTARVGGEVELSSARVRVAVVPGDELAWRRASRGGPRPGSRAGCRRRCRPRRRPRGSARAAPRARRRSPSSTPPKKRKPGRAARSSSYIRVTVLIFGWSGATPARTSPNGVGSSVDEVDLEAGVEQLLGRVEAGRPGADDGHAPPGAHRVVRTLVPHGRSDDSGRSWAFPWRLLGAITAPERSRRCRARWPTGSARGGPGTRRRRARGSPAVGPSRARFSRAGTPAASIRAPTAPRSGTTAPAATIAPAPTRASCRTIAPIPMSAPSSIDAALEQGVVADGHRRADDRSGGRGRSATTAPSWIEVSSPISMCERSPRSTAPNQTLARSPMRTSPVRTAFGARYTSRPIVGAMPSTSISSRHGHNTTRLRPSVKCHTLAGAVSLRRVARVQHERVAVGSREVGHVADAAVHRVGHERHALALELGPGRGDVRDVQRDRVRVGLELDAERVGLHDRDRQRAGLELGGGHLPPAGRALEAEHVAVERARRVEVARRGR